MTCMQQKNLPYQTTILYFKQMRNYNCVHWPKFLLPQETLTWHYYIQGDNCQTHRISYSLNWWCCENWAKYVNLDIKGTTFEAYPIFFNSTSSRPGQLFKLRAPPGSQHPKPMADVELGPVTLVSRFRKPLSVESLCQCRAKWLTLYPYHRFPSKVGSSVIDLTSYLMPVKGTSGTPPKK